MTTLTAIPEAAVDTSRLTGEQIIRGCGLYARDMFDLNGDLGPYKLAGVTTTVRWDPALDAAVFDLEGVALTVPSDALDEVGLTPAAAQEER